VPTTGFEGLFKDLACARRDGLDFDSAWAEAMHHVRVPEHREAAEATRSAWDDAFHRRGGVGLTGALLGH
jgi:hypothetical protein